MNHLLSSGQAGGGWGSWGICLSAQQSVLSVRGWCWHSQSGGTALQWDKPGLTLELGDSGQGSEPQSLGFLICEAGRRWPPTQETGLFGLTMCSASAKSSSRSPLSPMTMTQVESSRQWPPQSPAAGPWSQPARPGGTLSFWGAHALRHGGSPASQEATSVGLRGPAVTTVGAYPPTASCQVSPGAAAQSHLPTILHIPSPGPHGPGCSACLRGAQLRHHGRSSGSWPVSHPALYHHLHTLLSQHKSNQHSSLSKYCP